MPPLNEAYLEAAEGAGLKPQIPERPGRGSSDFGNVSQICPGVHVYFGIAEEEIAAHSIAFREAAGSDYGMQQMLRAVEAMALAGYRYLSDRDFRQRVKDDFTRSK